MGSKFNVVDILAFLCHHHSVDLDSLKNIVDNIDSHNFEPNDFSMAEYLSKQLCNNSLFAKFSFEGNVDEFEDDDNETLDFQNSTEEGQIFEESDFPFDSIEDDFYSDDNMSIDDSVNDDDDDDNEESLSTSKKVYQVNESIPQDKWEEAFGFWTKQNSSGPLVISKEVLAGKKRSARWVKARYSFVDYNMQNLRRWAQRELRSGGACSFRLINLKVLEEFRKARAVHAPVNDLLLRKWAYKIKNDLNPLFEFDASVSWCLKFKRSNNIVSRAITHKVSKDFNRKEEVLAAAAKEHVLKVKNLIEKEGFLPNEVINCDQSGFRREVSSFRTLNVKGDKRVYVSVGSKNATTHSVTVMPYIDASGGLCPSLYFLSQEKNGTFPKVRPPKFPANIRAFASRTSIMNTDNMITFLDLMIVDLIHKGLPKALLILDSWPVNKNNELWSSIVEKYSSSIKLFKIVIPAGCTGLVQPLDVYYFRPYKNLVKSIVSSLSIKSKVFQRNNMFGLHSFVHWQFCSPRFRTMIQYSFFKSGYYSERPVFDKTPTEYCFEVNRLTNCLVCEEFADIRCAHCEECFCFEHSVLADPHINCTTYN